MNHALAWAQKAWGGAAIIRGGMADREARIAARAAELRAENDRLLEDRLLEAARRCAKLPTSTSWRPPDSA